LQNRAKVQKKDAFTYLYEETNKQFDLIYIAPPQYKDMWMKAMKALDNNTGLLNYDGIIIVQIHPKEYLKSVVFSHFQSYDDRRYGDTLLVFYEQKSMP
jgi:16S rRNA G966 N2-methylase RsmD